MKVNFKFCPGEEVLDTVSGLIGTVVYCVVWKGNY